MKTYIRLIMKVEGLEIGNDLAYYAQFMLRNDDVIESVDMYVSKRSYSFDEKSEDLERHFIMALGGEIDVSGQQSYRDKCHKFIEIWHHRHFPLVHDSSLSAFYLLKTILNHGDLISVTDSAFTQISMKG